jgi:uncharacterized LabA/DUF88 family protein
VDRAALFVDAGNLIAAGGNLTLGLKRRSEINVAVGPLAADLAALVSEHSGLPVLRTYWYDAISGGRMSHEQEAVGQLDYTKLRLGRVVSGTQKGVDALLYRDLTALARERAIVTAYLLAGDEDLREGVAEAQSLGIHVILLAVEPSGDSKVSDALIREADHVIDLDAAFLTPHFTKRD